MQVVAVRRSSVADAWDGYVDGGVPAGPGCARAAGARRHEGRIRLRELMFVRRRSGDVDGGELITQDHRELPDVDLGDLEPPGLEVPMRTENYLGGRCGRPLPGWSLPLTEDVPVGLRRYRDRALEVRPQVGGGPEASSPGDPLDRLLGRLQQLLSEPDPLLDQPA